jgi:RNA-directed DNA polymerase
MMKRAAVDLERGESFGFLGFDFRYLRSLRGAMRPQYTPKLKRRTALLREIKDVFPRHQSQPGAGQLLRSRALERVLRLRQRLGREEGQAPHGARPETKRGFGWQQWSRPWLYDTLKLFNGYRVRRDGPKAAQHDRSHKP